MPSDAFYGLHAFMAQCPIQAFNISPSRVLWPSMTPEVGSSYLAPSQANNIYTISCLLGPDDPDIVTGLIKIKQQEQVSIKKAICQFLQVSDYRASKENNPNLISHRGRHVRICSTQSFSLSLGISVLHRVVHQGGPSSRN